MMTVMETIGYLSRFPADMKVCFDVSNEYDDKLWLVDVSSLDVVENMEGEFVVMLSDAVLDDDYIEPDDKHLLN